MSAMMHACGGTWQPLIGWMGRYRCDKCFVIGLKEKLVNARKSVLGGMSHFGREQVRPYKCKYSVKDADGKRAPCGQPMTGNDDKGKHACSVHRAQS